jgi:hypothetical protein
LATGTISINGAETLLGANRVNRNGISSVIGTTKAFPGTIVCGGAGCGFRTLTVTPRDPRVTVTVTGVTPGINVETVGYLNSFNVADVS